jgi:hypothetical protein
MLAAAVPVLLATVAPLAAAAADIPVSLLAVHAHRYQDFQKNAVVCEIFGELKNNGTQPVRSVLLQVTFLDAKKNPVYEEEMELPLRVVRPGNAKGDLRAVKPHEIGNFIQDTKQCPPGWQEGRIKVKLKSFTAE